MSPKGRILCEDGNYVFRVVENIGKTNPLEEIFFYPIKANVAEKRADGWDNYNEFESARKEIVDAAGNPRDDVTVFIMERGDEVLGTVFFIAGKGAFEDFLKTIGADFGADSKKCRLCFFHIVKEARGNGERWLRKIIFPYLREKGVETIFTKTTHKKAFSLYERLGEKVGEYTAFDDSGIPNREGMIFSIKLT